MFLRKLFTLLLSLAAITTYSQKNFSYTPENPKAGDVITFTYEPAGDLANTMQKVEAVAYISRPKGQKADELVLTQNGKKYTGSIQTDTSGNLINIAFFVDKKFDNNFNEGYLIVLNDEKGNPKKNAYRNMSQFYQFTGPGVGVEKNNTKALECMEKEFSLYPDTKKIFIASYLRLINTVKKDEAPAIVQKEIELALKQGLKDESDYISLESIYVIAKLPEQAKFITSLKKEKFPNGSWTVNEIMEKYYAETDPVKKKGLLDEIVQKANSDDQNWKAIKENIDYYKLLTVSAYANQKKWDEFKKAVEESSVTDKGRLALFYNNTAWEMQETGENLAYAEEISRMATLYAQGEMKNPTSKKPESMTASQWQKQNEFIYAMYADTYAMVLYRTGSYKKGLPYARDAAITINKENSAGYNNTYALLAEKVLPPKQYKKEIEQFVKDGKSTTEMKDILKRTYKKEQKSEAGFDDYMASLQKENYMKMIEELRKSILNEAAPSFALLDLDGKKINVSDLKGKVVIVDFWATWCGPCKASFPAMQKMVTKFKDNADVQFVFIDSWERGENKQKNAADFVLNNKYSFHVLLDTDDKVVEQFKVEGIPTKFVIDKNGSIRFKSIGFDGSDDKLVQELSAMIDLASGNTPKAF